MPPKMIDRTAVADFKFDGRPVKAGMPVKVPAGRLASLVAAGVVVATDDENEGVPKLEAPAIAALDAQEKARLAEAGAAAHSPSATGVSQHGAELLSLAATADRLKLEEAERERQARIKAQADTDAARARAAGQVSSARKLVDDLQKEADDAKARGDVAIAGKLQIEADEARKMLAAAQETVDALPPATAAGA